jgi:Mitochondrial carrier protein
LFPLPSLPPPPPLQNPSNPNPLMTESPGAWVAAFLSKGVLAGASATLSAAATSPLDVCKIRAQIREEGTSSSRLFGQNNGRRVSLAAIARGVVRHEGLGGLYKGMSASALREMTFSGTRFAVYEPLRRLLGGSDSAKETSHWHRILAGLASGAISATIWNPTDVLKVRLQADVDGTRYRSLRHAVATIFKMEGVRRGFYLGASTTTLRAGMLTGAQISTYDITKRTLLERGFPDDLRTHLLASMVSGVMTALVTNPIDIVRTRIMNERNTAKPQYRNPLQALAKVGFWSRDSVIAPFPASFLLTCCSRAIFLAFSLDSQQRRVSRFVQGLCSLIPSIGREYDNRSGGLRATSGRVWIFFLLKRLFFDNDVHPPDGSLRGVADSQGSTGINSRNSSRGHDTAVVELVAFESRLRRPSSEEVPSSETSETRRRADKGIRMESTDGRNDSNGLETQRRKPHPLAP